MSEESNTTTSAPSAVQDCHQLLAWIIPQLDKMPRLRRYTLGERLETMLLQVLENLIEASYSKSKTNLLKRANLRLDTARLLWRLARTLDAVSVKTYSVGAEQMVVLGRQIGGWRKASE